MILSLRGPVRVKVISIISCLKMEEHIMKRDILCIFARGGGGGQRPKLILNESLTV